jgi:hypothetical protein
MRSDDRPSFSTMREALDHMDDVLDFIRHEARHGRTVQDTPGDAYDRPESCITALDATAAAVGALREVCQRFTPDREWKGAPKRRRREPL